MDDDKKLLIRWAIRLARVEGDYSHQDRWLSEDARKLMKQVIHPLAAELNQALGVEIEDHESIDALTARIWGQTATEGEA
jgi:hypothetical protein